MTTPSSNGEAGPSSIPGETDQGVAWEQERPSFHFGAWSMSLGDTVSGVHRLTKTAVSGPLVVMHGCLCVASGSAYYPLQRIAIHQVQPPLFE